MADAICVQVVERIESLTHDQSSLCLCQMLSLCDEKEKLATLAKSTKNKLRGGQINMKWNILL